VFKKEPFLFDYMEQSEPDAALNQMISEANQMGQGADPNSLYADHVQEIKVTNIISQINPDNILSDIEHRIRGQRYNQMTKMWEEISTKSKKINEQIVVDFMSFLGAYLNQGVTFGNYSAQEINNIMQGVIEHVRDALPNKSAEYGIEGDYDEMNRIGHIINMSVFATLKQAMNGTLMKRLFNALRLTEHNNSGGGENKSLLDDLKFWK